MKKIAAALLLVCGSLAANAVPVFIGSYDVNDGPEWTDVPPNPVYSALEAAELVFGPAVGGQYLISVNGNDANNISLTGWYSNIGIGPEIYDQDFSRDLGDAGYGGPNWQAGDDISAFVRDTCGAGNCINYVFFEADAAVPEPAGLMLVAMGLVGMGLARRKRS